ncbi:MAG: hypothetical protein V7K50_07380 [Nostoc sp.]
MMTQKRIRSINRGELPVQERVYAISALSLSDLPRIIERLQKQSNK